jgi:glutamate synthase (NADPH) large chain
MSGGIAYVYDTTRRLQGRCNLELVELEPLTDADADEVLALVKEHVLRTGSVVGRNVIASWERGTRERFVRVMPRDYARALQEQGRRESALTA